MINMKIVSKLRNSIQNKITQNMIIKSSKKEYSTRYFHEEIICVATTIPERINVLHYSIESILHQSVRPHKIVIYLGKDEFKNVILPDTLLCLKQYGVEFCFVPDICVHTKYYYAFIQYNDKLVMTFDDDIVYRPNLLEKVLEIHNKYPRSIICTRAHRFQWDENKQLLPYNAWKWDVTTNKPSHMLVPTGVGAVLYQPKLFSDKVYEKENFLKITPQNDDLWLKWNELLNDISTVTTSRNVWFTVADNSQNISLNSSNVHRGINDLYCNQLIEFFGIGVDEIIKKELKLQGKNNG